MNEPLLALGTVILAFTSPISILFDTLHPAPIEMDDDPPKAGNKYEIRKAVAVGVPSFIGGLIAAGGLLGI